MKLTDDEIMEIWCNSSPTNFEALSFARAIEAALTEKQDNTAALNVQYHEASMRKFFGTHHAPVNQQWEQLENARSIIEKQARRIAELEAEIRIHWQPMVDGKDKRIAELEAALDKAISALESGLTIPTGEIAKLKEVRK